MMITATAVMMTMTDEYSVDLSQSLPVRVNLKLIFGSNIKMALEAKVQKLLLLPKVNASPKRKSFDSFNRFEMMVIGKSL